MIFEIPSRGGWFPWNGSKMWLRSNLERVFRLWEPSVDSRYIEPFVGGGSVSMMFRRLHPTTLQRLSDANYWLVSAYKCQIAGNLKLSNNYTDIQYWRELSDSDFSSLTVKERMTRFFVCLLTAWGNRWQVRNDGRFSQTINKQRCSQDYLTTKTHKIFSNCWLSSSDTALYQKWEKAVRSAQPGDLVYLDNPYPDSLGYGGSWTFKDQLDIIDWACDAITQDISVVVSNMSTLERLYKRGGFKTRIIQGPSANVNRATREEVLAWVIH
jgi:site-specific DNA-adenine methylase